MMISKVVCIGWVVTFCRIESVFRSSPGSVSSFNIVGCVVREEETVYTRVSVGGLVLLCLVLGVVSRQHVLFSLASSHVQMVLVYHSRVRF